jgi:hypothetical protein
MIGVHNPDCFMQGFYSWLTAYRLRHLEANICYVVMTYDAIGHHFTPKSTKFLKLTRGL